MLHSNDVAWGVQDIRRISVLCARLQVFSTLFQGFMFEVRIGARLENIVSTLDRYFYAI